MPPSKRVPNQVPEGTKIVPSEQWYKDRHLYFTTMPREMCIGVVKACDYGKLLVVWPEGCSGGNPGGEAANKLPRSEYARAWWVNAPDMLLEGYAFEPAPERARPKLDQLVD